MALKSDICDTLFSKLVKERSGWVCERCDKGYEPYKAMGLDCSHRQSRKHYSTRFDPENADSLCMNCHKYWWHQSPLEAWSWIEKDRGLGREFIDSLRAKSRVPFRGYKYKKKQIAASLRSELKRLQDLRSQGVTGRIEFESPYEGLI